MEIFPAQERLVDVVEYLRACGTPISAHGTLDVNQDGQLDYWITLIDPTYAYADTSLLISSGGGYQIVYLGSLVEGQPLRLEMLANWDVCQVFRANTQVENRKFILCPDPETGRYTYDDYDIYLQSHLRCMLSGLEEALLVGRPVDLGAPELQAARQTRKSNRYWIRFPNMKIYWRAGITGWGWLMNMPEIEIRQPIPTGGSGDCTPIILMPS